MTALPALLAGLVPVAALAVVHVLAGRLRGLAGDREAALVSAGGGISAAYVFLHLLPEIALGAGALEEVDAVVAPVPLAEVRVFLVALAGFTVFYLAERYAERHGSDRTEGDSGTTSGQAFWVHVVAFAAYNVAVAYTLPVRVADDVLGAVLFTVAIGVHVLVVDRGLATHYPGRYGHTGRWVLVGGLVLGWFLAVVAPPTAPVLGLTTAAVAGSVLVTVFQEELPRAGRSRAGPFLAGLVGYSALLLAVTWAVAS